MSKQVVVVLEGGRLGPFRDEEAAQDYLTLLESKGQIFPLLSPPPMTDLFLGALTHVRESGEDLAGFLQKHVETEYTPEEVRDAFDHAVRLNKVATFNEDALSDEELAILMCKRNPNNRIQAIKDLRRARSHMSLLEAKNLIFALKGL